MESSPDHKDTVRREFAKQASAYSTNTSITDPNRIARLVDTISPRAEARVLEVATGPGYVALGFAARCREVIGLDLTDAMLEIADSRRQERGLTNLSFRKGDAEHLPFGDGEFDVVVCRFAFHHLTDPARVLREMTRVCRPNGTVAVEDLVVSEHQGRGAYQNWFERLRDPSRTRAYALTELIGLFAHAGLEIENVYTDALIPEVTRWLADAQTPPNEARQATEMIERDAADDLSGALPFRKDGLLYFVQHTAAVIGRRLA